MIEFWLFVALLTVGLLMATTVFFARARRGDTHQPQGRRQHSNAALFRQRERELLVQLQDGQIDRASHRALLDELRLTTLVDLERAVDAAPASESGAMARGGDQQEPLRGKGVVLLAVFLIPLCALAFYLPQGVAVGASLDWQLGQQLRELRSSTGSQQRLTALDGLTATLSRYPRQLQRRPELRVLQAQVHAGAGRHDEAAQAYRELIRQQQAAEPAAQTQLADSYALLAQSLYFAAGQQFTSAASEALASARQLDGQQPLALGLSGIEAFQRGAYRSAIEFWESAAQHYPANAPQATILQRSIAAAQHALGLPASESTPDAQGPVLDISVAIDAAQRHADDSPDTPVFVFARAASGPPMPLAAKRLRLGDLPTTIRLSAEDAMTSRTLAEGVSVQVVARLSRSGAPTATPGDAQGIMDTPLTMGSGRHDVALTIDTVVD